MKKFDKIIFLPSGGLFYPPFAWAQPITNDFLLFQSDTGLYDSIFDYQLSIIRRYVRTSVDVMSLNVQDFFYIWTYLYIADLDAKNGIFIETKCGEAGCKRDVRVFMDISKLSINILNVFSETVPNTLLCKTNSGETIVFRRRKVEDNIIFSNLLLNSENSEEDWYTIVLFLATQIEKITHVPKSEYVGYLSYKCSYREIVDLYLQVLDFEKQFGIDNRIYFQCPHCKATQKTFLYDNLMNSMIFTKDVKGMAKTQENVIDDALYMARFRLLNYNEYMESVPLKMSPLMKSLISQMQFVPFM